MLLDYAKNLSKRVVVNYSTEIKWISRLSACYILYKNSGWNTDRLPNYGRTHRRVISIIWGLSDTVGHTYVCRRRCKIFFAKQKTISKKTLYVLLADVVHLSTCAAEGAQCRLSRPRVGLFYVVTLHLPTFVLNGTCGSISNNCHFTCAAGIR